MKTKLEIFTIIEAQFSATMTDIGKYLDDKSIPVENYKKDITEKLNKLGNNLISELIKE